MRANLSLSLLALAAAPAMASNLVQGISYLGQETFATGTQVAGTTMGGLSGITYDAANNRYHSIADDRSQINPARFYTMNIDLSGDTFGPGRVSFTGSTTLLRPDGTPFPATALDPEGIALTTGGNVFVSSEGDRNQAINPFVNRFSIATGQQNAALPVRTRYNTNVANVGIRNNLAFETLTISPDGQSLFTATENALFQDGPAADVANGSPCRIARYDLTTNQPAQEYVYVTDPVAQPPNPASAFATNGLVDMLAIDATHFIAIERSFSTGIAGTGNTIKLFEVSLDGATDVSGDESLPGGFNAADKRLILNLDDLGIPLDNIEGLTFGPSLSDGRRSLILVSDNNFSATQFTQFVAFGVSVVPEPSSIALLVAGAAVALLRRR